MILKKINLILLFLIFSSITFGYPCITYKFREQGTNNPITNVKWVIWACGDSQCTTINPSYWYQTGDSGTNSQAVVKFRNILPPSGKYLLLFFHDNYIYKAIGSDPSQPLNPYWASSSDPNTCSFSVSTWGEPTYYFNKKPNCRAPSSLSVSNKIGEWLPLTIDTSTQLDSDTQSAFTPQTSTYFPPDEQYKQYREVSTDVILTIRDKKTNQVVFTETNNLKIYSGTTKSTLFTFGPGNSNYKAGNYTVELRTRVVDSKCSSQVDDVKTQDIEIFPRLPDDSCIIIAEPMSIPSNSVNNQQININVPAYYYHLKKSYDSDYNLHLTYTGITSNYVLNLKDKNNQIRTFTGSFPKSFNDIRVNTQPEKPINTIPWLPNTYGNYEATITLTSSDTLCQGKQNDFSRGTRTDTLYILPRDLDNDNYKEDTDCNDNNPYINPGMSDISCDGVDQNCDGVDRTPDNQCGCKDGEK